ncbi:unnamed protein product [Owenia fusiformis]|uniref:Uncharacterized protein n=1 Tax=Owenia fusiformis TaxID=6347 RepID=A0A8J1T6H2_OWEFU|nr:unnamed protein product [Owenia fusiformis]
MALTDGTWSGRKTICGLCPVGWTEREELCYKVVAEAKSFTDAQDACEADGADLVSFYDQAEQDFVTDLVAEHQLSEIWIGLTENVDETYPRYKWLDGMRSTYTRWWYNERPNNGGSLLNNPGEDCTAAMPYFGRYWDDFDCEQKKAYMCKREQGSGCSPGENLFGGYCYWGSTSTLSWQNAEAECTLSGGHLVSIHSEEEDNFVFTTATSSAGITDGYWIGWNDIANENHFVWSDGSKQYFENWQYGEPNGAPDSQNCTKIRKSQNWQWQDEFCGYEKAYVCKGELPVLDMECVDEVDGCIDYVIADPTMCESYPNFANEYCKKTCGKCPGETRVCDRPGDVSNAIVVNDFANDPPRIGDNAELTCDKDFAINGGTLDFACVLDGRLNYEPQLIPTHLPTCKGKGEIARTLSNELVPREYRDNLNTITLERSDNLKIEHPGKITGWFVYSELESTVFMQVWRPGAGDTFSLIGQNEVVTEIRRTAVYSVDLASQIQVEAGDVIGFHQPNFPVPIPYDVCHTGNPGYPGAYIWQTESPRKLSDGDSLSFNILTCRIYSVGFETKPVA